MQQYQSAQVTSLDYEVTEASRQALNVFSSPMAQSGRLPDVNFEPVESVCEHFGEPSGTSRADTTSNSTPSSQSSSATVSSQRYQCAVCRRAFGSRHAHRRHIIQVHEESLRCSVPGCQQDPFAASADLRRHQRDLHPDMYPSPIYQCSIPRCLKQFRRKDNCRRHERSPHNIVA